MSSRFQLSMRQKVKRFTIEKWFWLVFIPFAWATHLIYLIALCNTLSIYALASAANSCSQGARAALEASTEEDA